MKCPWSPLLLALAVATALPAQTPAITPETPVTTLLLHQWLNSLDPRLFAWAATFARTTHNQQIAQEIPAILEHWPMPPMEGYDPVRREQILAIQAGLDTLIQEQVSAPASTIQAVAKSFPDQAVLLTSRLPLEQSRPALSDWIYLEHGNGQEQLLARVAFMMLAKDPAHAPQTMNSSDPGPVSFVARVVAASEQEMQIHVISPGPDGMGYGSGTCGDSFTHATLQGWPLIYSYLLYENEPKPDDLTVVDLAGDRITARRYEENRPGGRCSGGVEWLNPVTRHRLIAYWLGIQPANMPWQPVQAFNIIWTDNSSYQQQLGRLVATQQSKLQATIQTLHQQGLMTDDEARRVTPKLVITIQCDILPCPLLGAEAHH